VVGEVGVHDDDEVAGGELQAVDVGGAEAELAGARLEEDAGGAVGALELFGDFLGAVGGAVVDDYELPVEVAEGQMLGLCKAELRWVRGWVYFSVNVLFRSHVIIGRLRRSL